MSETKAFTEGQRVVWLKTARGGYGFRFTMPATVVRVSGSRATIRVDQPQKSRHDYSRLRNVLLENLRPFSGT